MSATPHHTLGESVHPINSLQSSPEYYTTMHRTRMNVFVVMTRGIVRAVTNLYPSRGYTHTQTRMIKESRAAGKNVCVCVFRSHSYCKASTILSVHLFSFSKTILQLDREFDDICNGQCFILWKRIPRHLELLGKPIRCLLRGIVITPVCL